LILTFSALKRAALVASNLMWKPFDTRFQDLLEDMDYQREILNTQLLIMIRNAQIGLVEKTEREPQFAIADHPAKTDKQKSKEMKEFMEKTLSESEETKRLVEKQHEGQYLILSYSS
jgi:hypothetical protein